MHLLFPDHRHLCKAVKCKSSASNGINNSFFCLSDTLPFLNLCCQESRPGPVLLSLGEVQEKRPDFDIVKLPSSGPRLRKAALEGEK